MLRPTHRTSTPTGAPGGHARPWSHTVWGLGALGLALAGCLGGGDGSGGSGDGGAGAGGGGGAGGGFGGGGGAAVSAAAPFFQQLAEISCDTYYRCCPPGAQGDPFGGRATCVSFIASIAADATEAPLESGKVTFDSGAASRCINAVRALAQSANCDGQPPNVDAPQLQADCGGAFVGRVPAGGSCVIEDEENEGFSSSSSVLCVPGLACFAAEGAGFGEDTCGTPAAEGEACRDDEGCVDGLFCDGSACAPKGANGAECNSSDGCESDFCDYGQSPSVCATEPPEPLCGGEDEKRARAPLARMPWLGWLPAWRALGAARTTGSAARTTGAAARITAPANRITAPAAPPEANR